MPHHPESPIGKRRLARAARLAAKWASEHGRELTEREIYHLLAPMGVLTLHEIRAAAEGAEEKVRAIQSGEHERDHHCTVGDDGCCTACGAHHGDPCLECGARAYHVPGCMALRRAS